jgi:hypothetical protein
LGEYALAVGQPNQSGLSDNDSESKLLIFPNPCSDVLRIGNIPQNSTAIAICDMTGKNILKQHLSNHQTSATIDIRSIAAGEYIVNVIGRNGQMKTKSTLTVIGTK